MAVLGLGANFNDFVFESPWVSPWFNAGNGSSAGLWAIPFREQRPVTWDKAGWLSLQVRTNPNQRIINLENSDLLFETGKLFLFPQSLTGSEFRLSFSTVPWVNFVSLDYGLVVFNP